MTKAQDKAAEKEAKAARRVTSHTAAENAPTPKVYRRSIIRIRGERAQREARDKKS